MNLYAKYFLLSGIIGWIAENIWNIKDKEFRCNPIARLLSENYCLIPFTPSYAFAGIIIVIANKYIKTQLNRLFFYLIIFNMIEFIGGLLGEKILCKNINTCQSGNKLWDYSDNPNLFGHIDIKHSIYWIALGYMGDKIYEYIEENHINNLNIGITLFAIIIVINIVKPFV